MAGTTRDPGFPTTPGAYQTKLKGDADAFVAKFSPEGHLVYSTLIGGSKREHHVGITVDALGAVYLVGGTHSADFPTTPGAYDVTFNGEKDWGGDVYILKLDPTGSKVLFSTFIGGRAQETASSIRVNKQGAIVIAGTTHSPDFPTTPGAFDRIAREQNAFVLKLSSDGSGNLALIGVADSAIFPATPGAYRREGSGPETFVVARLLLRDSETQTGKDDQ